MTAKPKAAIAKRHPVLYFYVLINILLEIIYFFYGVANSKETISHTSQYISIGILIAIYAAIYGYLLTSRNLRGVKIILKIFLVLQVLGLLFLLRAVNSMDFIISVASTSLTFYTYRIVSGKKQVII